MGNVVVAAERLPKLDDYLCFAVYSANLPLHRLLKPLLDEVGLTYPQYLVLIALYDDDHQLACQTRPSGTIERKSVSRSVSNRALPHPPSQVGLRSQEVVLIRY